MGGSKGLERVRERPFDTWLVDNVEPDLAHCSVTDMPVREVVGDSSKSTKRISQTINYIGLDKKVFFFLYYCL